MTSVAVKETFVFHAQCSLVRETKDKLERLDAHTDIWRRIKDVDADRAKARFLNLITKRFAIDQIEMISEYAMKIKIAPTIYLYVSAYRTDDRARELLCDDCGRDIAHAEAKRGYCPRCDAAIVVDKSAAKFDAAARLAAIRNRA